MLNRRCNAFFEARESLITEDQITAFDAITEWLSSGHPKTWCYALRGFAGTGKTHVVAIIASLIDSEKRIAITAPTNKAVSVLHNKPNAIENANYCTIHALLNLTVKENMDGTTSIVRNKGRGSADTLSDYDFVVVDEASMISAEMLVMIKEAASSDALVLFVGDPAQLPPVDGDGSLSPTMAGDMPAVMMESIVRQAKDNPIIAASLRVRQAQDAGVKFNALDLLQGADGRAIKRTTDPARSIVSAIQHGIDARLLSFDNKTVISYNRRIHGMLYPRSLLFVPGERIVFNSPFETREMIDGMQVKRRITNGTEAVVVESEMGSHAADPERESLKLAVDLSPDEDYSTIVEIFVAADEAQLQADIAACFDRYKSANALARHTPAMASGHQMAASSAASQGWQLRKMYAAVRHTYAMTIHKSQGSGFGCAIIDSISLHKAQDAKLHNQLLYVAVTRAIKYLMVT